jgi:hypothetical protein
MKSIYSRLTPLLVLGLSAAPAMAQTRPRPAAQSPAQQLNPRTLAIADKNGVDKKTGSAPVTGPGTLTTPITLAAPQPRLLMGTVLNEQGMPLAGAVVLVASDHSSATSTNAEGQYVIRSAVAEPVLRVSYVGYQDAEYPSHAGQPVTFTLEPVDNYSRQFKKQSKAAQKAHKQ